LSRLIADWSLITDIKYGGPQQMGNDSYSANAGSRWVRITLFNLLLVAVLGCAMRYKIAYSLPWLPQKNVLNGHSHFAFAGWLSQILMTLMVQYLSRKSQNEAVWKKYNWLLWANLLTAYGMLFSFPFEGYGIISIVFSTLSIFASYAFTIVYWRDLNRLPKRTISDLWFKGALIWNVISSAGAFGLAYMMAAHINHEHWYLAAIYFFLHFQYNGWFFFACGGLLYSSNIGDSKQSRVTLGMLLLSCGPAYFLSILWAHIPTGTYVIAILAALAQLIGWIGLINQVFSRGINLLATLRPTVRVLLIFALIAGSVKFLLQLGSVHPELAKLAFGFRPIVIGYLHLVLLGMITIFIIAYLKHVGSIAPGGWRKKGLVVFVAGIVIQETLLMAQGTAAISYNSIPFVNEFLFASALIMLAGILLLNLGMMSKVEIDP
jgi:hypothetical protein